MKLNKKVLRLLFFHSFLILLSINLKGQNGYRIATSSYYEFGLKFSPNGNRYLYVGANEKNNNQYPNKSFSVLSYFLKDSSMSLIRNIDSAAVIRYPEIFMCWTNQDKLIKLNTENNKISLYDCATNNSFFLLDAPSYFSNQISQNNTFRDNLEYDTERGVFSTYEIKENNIYIYSIKNNIIDSNIFHLPSEVGNIENGVFDIRPNYPVFTGLVINKNYAMDLISYDFRSNVLKKIIKDDDISRYSGSILKYADNSKEIVVFNTQNENATEMSFQVLNLKLSQSRVIYKLNITEYGLIDYNYYSGNNPDLILTVSSRVDAPEVNISSYNKFEKILTSLYIFRCKLPPLPQVEK